MKPLKFPHYLKDKVKTLLGKNLSTETIYTPATFIRPVRLPVSQVSAWKGLELVIPDIIAYTGVKKHSCLDLGVEFGYSTAVFANYFESVTGVDLFTGDIHAGFKADMYAIAKANLSEFDNVKLVKANYKDFIASNDSLFDMIHVDIIHTYDDTWECGLWAAEHSSCTLFHDTESFPDVKKAVVDIARRTKKRFSNYPHCNGLGIVY